MITQRSFGSTAAGDAVERYTLKAGDLEMSVLSYGAIIHELHVPDKSGNLADIVLGFDTLKEYELENTYFGCVVGRYANRIARGRFSLDGEVYQLATNNGPNHLHGGLRGFDKRVWQAEIDGDSVLLKLHSPDGEEGYPGNLDVLVRYSLSANALQIDYEATTDAATIINLTNHSYFNLAGQGDILDHVLQLRASKFTPVDETFIPLGNLCDVAGTPFDFTRATAIGERIDQDNVQLERTSGYDHNWVLDADEDVPDAEHPVAELREPISGRKLQLYTTQPGVQVYSGNLLGAGTGKQRRPYAERGGLCLETQHFPDSPNQPDFPSVRLEPGKAYAQTTRFTFDTV